MRKGVLFLAVTFLLASSASLLHAQQAPASSPSQPAATLPAPSDTQAPAQASRPAPTSTAQTWTGKVSKKGSDFMLEDKDTKASYKLDDAAQAGGFDGKDVKVTGTLDSQTHTIHVQTIEES